MTWTNMLMQHMHMAMQSPAAARALAVFVIWLAVVGWTVGDPLEDLQCNQIVFQASAALRLAASCTGTQPATDCEQQCKRRIADLTYGIARKQPDSCFFINYQFDWDIRIQNIHHVGYFADIRASRRNRCSRQEFTCLCSVEVAVQRARQELGLMLAHDQCHPRNIATRMLEQSLYFQDWYESSGTPNEWSYRTEVGSNWRWQIVYQLPIEEQPIQCVAAFASRFADGAIPLSRQGRVTQAAWTADNPGVCTIRYPNRQAPGYPDNGQVGIRCYGDNTYLTLVVNRIQELYRLENPNHPELAQRAATRGQINFRYQCAQILGPCMEELVGSDFADFWVEHYGVQLTDAEQSLYYANGAQAFI